jgi:hypothetical protein
MFRLPVWLLLVTSFFFGGCASPRPEAIPVVIPVSSLADEVTTPLPPPACIVGPEEVEVSETEKYTTAFSVPLAEAGKEYSWQIEPAGVTSIYGSNDKETFVVLMNLTRGKAAEKQYFVSFVSYDAKQHDTHTITLKGPVTPEPPVPPGPTPVPPTPPTPPVPPPTPAPISEPGFRVLIVYEAADMPTYPIETQMILTGVDIRDFLKANCVAEDKHPGFRIYDKDVNLGGELEVWKQAMTRERSAVPWVLISNGTTGFEGPLPKTPSEFLELCKKYLPTK